MTQKKVATNSYHRLLGANTRWTVYARQIGEDTVGISAMRHSEYEHHKNNFFNFDSECCNDIDCSYMFKDIFIYTYDSMVRVLNLNDHKCTDVFVVGKVTIITTCHILHQTNKPTHSSVAYS